MAPEIAGTMCCCYGDADHLACCPGYFRNEETGILERCDECGIFESDEDAAEAALEVLSMFREPTTFFADDEKEITLQVERKERLDG